MRRHSCSRNLSLRRQAAAIPQATLLTMMVLWLGGCDNSGIGTTRPEAGVAGQSGTQSTGSSPGGTSGAESSGGRETGGISTSGGRGLSGGSTATGGDAGRAGGTASSTASGTAGKASGGASTGGGTTAGAGGTSGGKGGTSVSDTSSRGGTSSSTPPGGTGGNTGGKGGAPSSTASGGSGGVRSGDSTGTGSGGSKPVGGTFAASGPIETALAPIITSFCAAARHCCSLAGINATPLADCESQFVKRNSILGVAILGEASIDSTAVAACQAAYDEAATSCSAKAVRSACTDILVGKQGENAPCGKGGTPMYFGGMACDRSAGATACLWTGDANDPAVTGTCLKVGHGKKGDPCLYTCESGDECSFEQIGRPTDTLITLCFEDEGLFCSGPTDPPTCQPLVAQGGSCDGKPDACKSTDYCDSVSKTCKPASTAGQSCLYSSCLEHLSCGADKKCVEPFWEFATEFGSCSGVAQLQ